MDKLSPYPQWLIYYSGGKWLSQLLLGWSGDGNPMVVAPGGGSQLVTKGSWWVHHDYHYAASMRDRMTETRPGG